VSAGHAGQSAQCPSLLKSLMVPGFSPKTFSCRKAQVAYISPALCSHDHVSDSGSPASWAVPGGRTRMEAVLALLLLHFLSGIPQSQHSTVPWLQQPQELAF
jgi:hypothetical protein